MLDKGYQLIRDKSDRQKEILKLFKNIDRSGLSAEKYFRNHPTPISLPHNSRLKKRFDQQGMAGIEDNRTAGNARKLNPQQVELVRAVLTYNRYSTSKSLQEELQSEWEIELDTSRIDQLRRKFDLPRLRFRQILFKPSNLLASKYFQLWFII